MSVQLDGHLPRAPVFENRVLRVDRVHIILYLRHWTVAMLRQRSHTFIGLRGARQPCVFGVVAIGLWGTVVIGAGSTDRPQRMTFYFTPLVLVMVYNGKMYARIGALLRETQFVASQRVVTKLRRYWRLPVH